ncbi:MAG: hypothetical protein ABIO72_04615 [Patescibacteria group bacterium]
MIAWQIPVICRIVAAHMVTPILSKKLAGERSRTRSIRLMFFVCALLAASVTLITRTPIVFDTSLALVCGLGALNSFAVYSMWRAQAISLSRQALFTMMDDVIPVVMGYFLLGEKKLFNLWLAVGVLICFGGAFINTLFSRKQEAAKSGESKDWHIFIWIGFYSLIWGVARFAFRYFAVDGMPMSTFIMAWYGGSFIGSNIVMFLAGKKEMGPPLPRRQIVPVSLLAIVIALCLGLEYWASTYAPLAVTQPIFQVTEMIFPVLIGLFYFKEAKALTWQMKATFAVAFAGSLIIALSY